MPSSRKAPSGAHLRHNAVLGKVDAYEEVSWRAMAEEMVESLDKLAGAATWYRDKPMRALLSRSGRPRLVGPSE